MKKILILLLAVLVAVPAFAQVGTPSTTSATTLNLACVQMAVTTRENAILAAFNAFSTTMSSALSTRGTELNSAWGLTDSKARREARNTAWKKYQTTSSEAKKTFRSAKKSAWDKFKTDSKACKVPVVESESSDNLAV